MMKKYFPKNHITVNKKLDKTNLSICLNQIQLSQNYQFIAINKS